MLFTSYYLGKVMITMTVMMYGAYSRHGWDL